MKTTEEIFIEALSLPSRTRAALAEKLLAVNFYHTQQPGLGVKESWL